MKTIYSVALLMCLLGVFYAQAQEIRCPAPKEGEDIVLIPHPTNCNHYFVCDYGRPIVMKCPEGLHFNPEVQVCDYPFNVECITH
ncbi:PREDICTED: peritrophin-1-like [Cyphomyrmex costatus]|uniref:peritrophin-1-like n=1 Tax=Cyphomyrmex costatus TaxID=456900 RepID=UPI0008524000|nr:PREDICTED: peritrophin-1-like [Cyphomyrmex costatus]